MTKKRSAEMTVRDIRRATRRDYSATETRQTGDYRRAGDVLAIFKNGWIYRKSSGLWPTAEI